MKIIRSAEGRCIGTDGHKSSTAPLNSGKHSVEISRFFIQMTDLHVCKGRNRSTQYTFSAPRAAVDINPISRRIKPKLNDTAPISPPCLSSWQVIKWQLLLCSEGDSMLNTSPPWPLIPHCLLICTKDPQMDESEGGDEGCVVKSSHADVKQAHAEASPQVQKEMKYLFDFFFSLFFLPPSSLLPFHPAHYQIY